jgi:ABC-type sulfate/molybdate transport systems ATPase subunit
LDDPLSAVDAHVGQALFQQCICGALAGKTVLLVTNALHYVHRADHVVWLVDGAIQKQGSYDAVTKDPAFQELVGGHVVQEDASAGGGEKGGKGVDGAKQGLLAQMNVSAVKEKGLTGAQPSFGSKHRHAWCSNFCTDWCIPTAVRTEQFWCHVHVHSARASS